MHWSVFGAALALREKSEGRSDTASRAAVHAKGERLVGNVRVIGRLS